MLEGVVSLSSIISFAILKAVPKGVIPLAKNGFNPLDLKSTTEVYGVCNSTLSPKVIIAISIIFSFEAASEKL